MSALALSGVSKRFGGLQALNQVSLSVAPGEVLGLIGPNGAGKSTLVACITGVLRIDAGAIRFQERDIQRLAPHRRARFGIARSRRSFQPHSKAITRQATTRSASCRFPPATTQNSRSW